MLAATLTSKGQVTVPKAIRQRLDLQAGDRLEFSIDEKGRILVRVAREASGICGVLRDYAPEKPVSVEEMKRAIRKRAAASSLPSRR